MIQACVSCHTNFEITDSDLQFYDSISLIIKNQKFLIPPPKNCPSCRQQRRLAICNERNLYPHECQLCKKRILSEHPQERNLPTYCRECWHSDKWDARNYGRDFDFSRPFFPQLKELKLRTPSLNLNVQGNLINSDYIHYAGSCKNCYLVMHADFCEDCYYGYGFKKNTSCIDGFYNLHCELCYDCIDVHKSYGLIACQDCINCNSSAFLRDCIGCKNCFLCTGLRNKEYCFENIQLTKEEYQQKITKIDLGSFQAYQNCQNRLRELEKSHTFKEFQGNNLQNCFGNHLYNCKDSWYCFDCEDVENAKYCFQIVLGGKNIYDIYQYGTNLQQSYECSISGEDSYHLLFCDNCHVNSSDLIYCWYMLRSRNCFGCANMQGASYCILNKQYSQEEYENLLPQIIAHLQKTGEWGEFFPLQMNIHGYNKTSAQLYFPLNKELALAKNLPWDDYEPPQPQVANIIVKNQIPDHIQDITDDILNAAIQCEITNKLFKITPHELKFYRQQRIALPRRHPDQRHLDRFHKRNPRQFWRRQCANCQKDIVTTYNPQGSEIVYCEKCYLEKIH